MTHVVLNEEVLSLKEFSSIQSVIHKHLEEHFYVQADSMRTITIWQSAVEKIVQLMPLTAQQSFRLLPCQFTLFSRNSCYCSQASLDRAIFQIFGNQDMSSRYQIVDCKRVQMVPFVLENCIIRPLMVLSYLVSRMNSDVLYCCFIGILKSKPLLLEDAEKQ